jgi:signal peptidase II
MKIPRIAYAAYGFAALVILVDQLVKAWILTGLDLREVGRVEVMPPVFNLSFVLNDGVSFGLFGGGSAGRWPGGRRGSSGGCWSRPSAW